MGTVRYLVLAAVGIVVASSLAVGGWQWWSPNDAAGVDPGPANVPADPQPAKKAPPVVTGPVVAVAPPAPVVDPVPEPAKPAPQESPRKKQPPEGKSHDRPEALRATMAQVMHNEAYQHFITQPGMGYSRLGPLVSVMPREWKMPEWTSEELSKEPPPVRGHKDIELIHGFSLLNFGASNTKKPEERWREWYAKKQPKKEFLWEIKSLDLVGLVMHEEPVVYISETVPKMKDLKNTPTRDLDLFEAEGLQELQAGKSLFVRSKGDTIRVLGPITAQNACLKCHAGAQEGDLLGAFSYTLRHGQYRVSNRFGQPNPPRKPGKANATPPSFDVPPSPSPKVSPGK